MHKSWMWKQRSYREQFQGDEGNGGSGGSDASSDGHGGEADQQTGEPSADDTDPQPDDEDGVVVTIGDEAPPAAQDDEVDGQPAPHWVRELRKEVKESKKRVRELEQAAAAREASTAPQAATVGDKPTLESCEYDAEAYAEKLLAWTDAKRKADEQAAATRKEQEAANAAWAKRQADYNTAKAALKVPDFDDAEHVVRETMNQTQLGIMVSGADKPELLVYALGRNPAKAKELAGIKDPVKFAFAVAKLETQLKVQPRKNPPPAERAIRGSAGGATAVDSTLARLEADAERTGDRSKIIAYNRAQRAKQAA